MDRRALTVDPNASSSTRKTPKWWKEIGPTQKPSPYATASWVYRRYSDFEYETLPADLIPEVFDNWSDFSVNVYPTVLDGGLFSSAQPPDNIYDEGGFDGEGPVDFVKHYFSSIKVYDFLASTPGKYEDIVIGTGLLSIDSDGSGQDFVVVDPSELSVYDNSDNLQNPIPNPSSIYDSQTFAQWGQGIVLEELVYEIRDGIQYLINTVPLILPDGALLTTESGLEIEVNVRATEEEDLRNPGDLLGQLEYEVLGSTLTITNWSHYNWHDATPVRKAFKSLMNSLPTCVDSVLVQDQPKAFWTELGFVSPTKGSEVLVYNEKIKKPVTY